MFVFSSNFLLWTEKADLISNWLVGLDGDEHGISGDEEETMWLLPPLSRSRERSFSVSTL